jgi:hypothetical protein
MSAIGINNGNFRTAELTRQRGAAQRTTLPRASVRRLRRAAVSDAEDVSKPYAGGASGNSTQSARRRWHRRVAKVGADNHHVWTELRHVS